MFVDLKRKSFSISEPKIPLNTINAVCHTLLRATLYLPGNVEIHSQFTGIVIQSMSNAERINFLFTLHSFQGLFVLKICFAIN